jgi:hypothetical protein
MRGLPALGFRFPEFFSTAGAAIRLSSGVECDFVDQKV